MASRYAAYQNNNRFELNFSLCKELCEVDLKLPDPYEKGNRASLIRRQVKLRITNKINKALVTLSKIGVDAKLVWEKSQGHRWEYNPVLVFSVSRKLRQVEHQMKTKRSADELKNRLFIEYLKSKDLPNNSKVHNQYLRWLRTTEDYGLKWDSYRTLAKELKNDIADKAIISGFNTWFPQYKS